MGRLANAWGALLGRKASGLPEVDGDTAHGLLWSILRQSMPPRKGTRELMLAYRQSPWLYAAVSRLAGSLASTNWKLYAAKKSSTARAIGRLQWEGKDTRNLRAKELRRAQQTGDVREIESHPFLDLLDRPNPLLTGLYTRKVTRIHREIKGESFWIKERNGSGMPIEAWPVPPHWVTDIPRAGQPFYRVQYLSWNKMIPEADVLWFRDPDPENPYGRGTGVGEVLSDELDADEYASRLVKSKMANGAIPDLLIGVEGAQEEQLREAAAKWDLKHQGADKLGKTHWHSGKLKVEKLTPSFVDLQLSQLRTQQRDIVQQVIGLPPEIMGIVENSNRATIAAADYIYGRWCLVPRLEDERADYQEKLVPEFDDRLIVEYESPVPADSEFQQRVMAAAPFAFDVDEHRELAGLGELDGKRGKIYAVPAGYTFEKDLTKVKPVVTAPAYGGRGPRPDPAWAKRTRLALPQGWDSRAWGEGLLRAQDRAAGSFRDVLVPLFRAQRDAVLAALQPARARAQEEQDDEKDRLVQEALDAIEETAAEWAAAAEPELRKELETLGRETLIELDLDPDAFSVKDPKVAEWAADRSFQFAQDVNETTQGTVKTVLSEALDEGETMETIAERIKETYDAWSGDDGDEMEATRAERIARTETVAAQNFGVQAAFEQSEIVAGKQWMTLGDSAVRASHAALDGETVGLEGNLSNGLRYPGDMSAGNASETVNCRCSMQPAIEVDDG